MPHLTRTEQSVLYARMQEPRERLTDRIGPYRLYSRVVSARSRLTPVPVSLAPQSANLLKQGAVTRLYCMYRA